MWYHFKSICIGFYKIYFFFFIVLPLKSWKFATEKKILGWEEKEKNLKRSWKSEWPNCGLWQALYQTYHRGAFWYYISVTSTPILWDSLNSSGRRYLGHPLSLIGVDYDGNAILAKDFGIIHFLSLANALVLFALEGRKFRIHIPGLSMIPKMLFQKFYP